MPPPERARAHCAWPGSAAAGASGAAPALDTLTAEARSAITLLQERRTALISAAVTGWVMKSITLTQLFVDVVHFLSRLQAGIGVILHHHPAFGNAHGHTAHLLCAGIQTALSGCNAPVYSNVVGVAA